MVLIDSLIVIAGWLFWMMPFVIYRRNAAIPQKRDRRARWGIGLQSVAYSIIWIAPFRAGLPPEWRVILSIILLILAAVFCWKARRTLGMQWRIDAALNSDHQLIRCGPYRLMRNPIYTSMLLLLVGTGLITSTFLLLACAIAVLMVGIQIRVNTEEKLLEARFGDEFRDYRRSVPAYIPFLKFAPKAG